MANFIDDIHKCSREGIDNVGPRPAVGTLPPERRLSAQPWRTEIGIGYNPSQVRSSPLL